MIDSELIAKLLEETPKRNLKLPDRLNQPNSMVKIWINVFTNRRRLKNVAEELRKSKGLTLLPRDFARVLDPEVIVAHLLNSRDGRYEVFNEKLPFNWNSWVGLIFQVHERVSKKLPLMPDPLVNLGFNLEEYDIQMNEDRSHDVRFLKALSYYVAESAYADLSNDDKDLADFFVNCALCEIGDYSFIVDFLDRHPFLKNRNQMLYDGAIQNRKSELANFENQEFGDFASECADQLSSLAKVDCPGHLLNLIGVAKLVDKIVNDRNFGLRHELTTRINTEKNGLIDFVSNHVSKAVLIPSLKDMPVWQECLSLIDRLQGDLESTTLSQQASEAITEYCFKRDEFQKTMTEFPKQFNSAYEDFKRYKAEVAEEALREDSDGESIIAKSKKVIEANAALTASSEQAGNSFVTLLKVMNQLWLGLKNADDQPLALTQDKPAIGSDAPAEIAPAAVVDTAAMDQLAAENKTLLEKLESANAQVAQMEEMTSTLEEENAMVKRENHALKQRVAYEPPKHLDIQPIDVTNSTLIALVTQGRKPNPEEILRFYQSLAPDRLEVMECAYKSAYDAQDFHLPYRLSELLYKLIFEYLDLIKAGNPDAEARKVFGNAYSAKESETVTSSKRLRAMREFYYGGDNVLFLQHLGIGRSYGTQKAIRLYFKVIEGKIVIAHCGVHFETAQTN